jgi:DMSO/TMAO reductase YedYZ molybdopterin-dependent catalytic subunit
VTEGSEETSTAPPIVGAAIGVLAAAVAIATGQLAGVLIEEQAAPLSAVGSSVIDLAPTAVKEFAISTFGTADKLVLIAGICAVLAILAAVMGTAIMRRRWLVYAGFGGFGALGAVAASTRPGAGSLAVMPSLIAVVCGLVAALMLLRSVQPVRERRDIGDIPSPLTYERRRFLATGAAVTGVAIVAGVAGRLAGATSSRTKASRAALKIPTPADPAPPIPSGADLRVQGLSPFITPNDRFYRVDTALIVPKIDAADWRLRIHGMVDREIELDIDTLLSRPLIERDITLSCVSNEVGDRYVGNARWIGAPLKPILEEAGVHADADQLVSTSSDGITIGTPTAVLMDGRDAMLAVAMNGEPLPLEHGFPVRMVVPGLYGYVSATKWVVDMELTTFDAFDAYWARRGWAARAPVKTMSRIDTPRAGASVGAGPVPIAGVAWAQHLGIDKVEVQIDGRWHDARLSVEDTTDTWRQWVFDWDATPGIHTIRARATDRSGYTQTSEMVPPAPDGATGWHAIDVNVS